MPLYLYSAADSFPYRLDPVTKIIALLVVFQIALTLQHPLYLGGLLLLLLLCMLAWRVLFRVWRGIWVLMAVLFLFTWGMWSLFLWWGAAAAGVTGVMYGAGMGFRLDLMLIGGVVFLITTRVEEFTHAMSRLGLPYRVGFALTLAFRLVPLFLENALTVTEAQTCRGWEVDRGGPVARMRRYVPLIVPVFISSLRSADNLSMALESKGFGGATGARRAPGTHRFGWRDAACLGVLLVLDAAVITLRLRGFGTVI
jgi:energy-coupling factor transport system permease protein